MVGLGTYTDLRSSVLAWLARAAEAGEPVYDNFQTFVTLAETRMFQELRVRTMETRLEAPISEPIESLPARFLGVVDMSIKMASGYRRALTQVGHRQLRDLWTQPQQVGDPYVYSLVGNEIHFGPFVEHDPDAVAADLPTMELAAFTAPVALTEDRPTNEVLSHHPDTYLYATLVQACAFLMSDQLPVWSAAYDAAIAAANADFVDSQGTQIQSPVSSHLII